MKDYAAKYSEYFSRRIILFKHVG